jgi:hypothetical protein
MDRYDGLIILDKLKKGLDFLKESNKNPYELYKRYLLHKKDFILRRSYIDILRRCKGEGFLRKPIEKAFTFNTNQRYAWQILNRVSEKKVVK